MDNIIKEFEEYCTNPNINSGKAVSYANAIRYLCAFLNINIINNSVVLKFKEMEPDIKNKNSFLYRSFLSYLVNSGQVSYLSKGFVKAALTHFFSFWYKRNTVKTKFDSISSKAPLEIFRDSIANDIDFDILKNENIDEDLMPNTSKIVLVEWDYLHSHTSQKQKHNSPTKRDYDTLAKIQKVIGVRGEELILNYEKEKLINAGFKDLAEKVKWVSDKVGDGLGYDIHSFDENGNDKFIEVKATTNPIPRLQFFISANEAKKYFEETNLFIYFVFDIKNQPKLHIVDREQFKNDFLTPVQYLVNVDVLSKVKS